jgi:hypothetical protein
MAGYGSAVTGAERLHRLLEANDEADGGQLLIDSEAERIALRRSFEMESLGLHANFVSPWR